jgi:hypothetical protein
MMHGFRNLPPTGGMREMFKQKWAKMVFQGFNGWTEATHRGMQRDYCSLSPPVSL